MNGKLTLSKALSDCKTGEEKEITLSILVTENGDDGLKAEVLSVVDYEEEHEEKKPAMKEGKEMGKLAPAAKKAMSYS